MKLIIISLITSYMMITQAVMGHGTDYTSRTFTINSCELFAKDAYQASDNFSRGVVLQDIQGLIESSPVADSMKNRVFQAIQLVWKNQLDNPTLAYNLAMGLCLKPKQNMAPMDEPWSISLRTSKEYF